MKKGFKAFNKGLICLKQQYQEGEEYKIKGSPELCSKGFHYCENPLDTLNYYDLCESEFAEIEDLGDTKTDGSKNVTNHIKIKAKIDLKAFIKASFELLWEKSNIKDAGYSSQLAASGNSSQLAASGNYSQLAASGENSICAAIGVNSKVKGIIGTWITLAEYDDNYKVVCVKSTKIDGKKLKADTWYILKDKKFQEAE